MLPCFHTPRVGTTNQAFAWSKLSIFNGAPVRELDMVKVPGSR